MLGCKNQPNALKNQIQLKLIWFYLKNNLDYSKEEK
jgi:hypothetical protein